MVKIRENSGDRPIRVSAFEQNSSVNVYHDIDNLYSGESKDWAIKMDGKVNNEDYSSKYWAAESKTKAELAAGYASDVAEAIEQAELSANAASLSATNASSSASSANGYKSEAKIWAEGDDAEVSALGGVHSAKVWAELADTEQVQADWNVSDSNSQAFIKNKPDLSVYLTSSALNGYAQSSDIPTKTSELTNDSGFITSSSIPTVPTKTSDLTNDSGYITSSALSGYAQTSDIPTKTSELTNDSGFITQASIPTVPTKTSDLTNDSGYITSSALNGYAQTSDIPTTAADVSALPDTTKYANSLDYTNNLLSLIDQDGTTLDSVTITSSGVTPSSGGISLPIGSQVLCDHVLTYEERANLEPAGGYLYKTGISAEYQGHSNTYQNLLQEYQAATQKKYIDSNIQIVGNLSDNNGIISGFTNSTNYAYSNKIVSLGKDFEFYAKFKTGADFTRQLNIVSSQNTTVFAVMILSGGTMQVNCGTTAGWGPSLAGHTILSANTTYYIKVVYKNDTYSCYLSTDGINYTQENSDTYTETMPDITLNIGVGRSNTASFNGSIDLKETYLISNGVENWNGANYSLLNPNGREFYNVQIKSSIDSIYASTGKALMWGVDETNERMILPRTNFYDNVGKLYFVV